MFRAHDSAEGRLVAVKAFRLDLTPERAAELADALQALAARDLSHPSIAAPIAAGVEDDVAWFAQAYVPAESLDTALRQYGPPPVADALTIVTQLAGALDFAAAAGVVHGSLHPRDVLVSPGETHLVDLGVATALESCGVRAPVRRPYSAPERGAGRPVTREGDIFALGAIAFELLGGQPVTGAGDEAVTALPDIPGANREALLETLSFALALAPDERYATALAFAAPLKKALADALMRPAAPRRRRTTRPPEMLLPIADADLESAAGTVGGPGPAEDAVPPADDDTTDAFRSFRDAIQPDEPTGPDVSASSHELAGQTPPDATEDGSAYPSRPPRRAVRKPVVERSPAEPPPASLSDLAEPEPDASAAEPLLAAGATLPLDEAGTRFSSLDAESPASPLDSAELAQPAEPLVTWNATEPDLQRPAPGAGPPVEDVDNDPTTRYGTPDDVFPPLPGDDDQRAARRDAEPARPGAAWRPLVAMLLIGFVAGLAGGWWLFAGRTEGPAVETEASVPPGAAADTRPREFTDDAVPGPEAGSQPGARDGAAPPAAAPAPAAEVVPRGRLVVRTRPAGARVEVGGASRGGSPLTLTDLPLGQHSVRVSARGYNTEQRRVTLSARSPSATLDVTLKRTAAPAARAPRQPATFTGTLVVESRPAGAKVFLDGRGIGVTPVTLSNVKVGSHVVRIELTGYRRWSTPVRIVSGERERVAASLEEEPRP